MIERSPVQILLGAMFLWGFLCDVFYFLGLLVKKAENKGIDIKTLFLNNLIFELFTFLRRGTLHVFRAFQ